VQKEKKMREREKSILFNVERAGEEKNRGIQIPMKTLKHGYVGNYEDYVKA
jgi:hypothetical protein